MRSRQIIQKCLTLLFAAIALFSYQTEIALASPPRPEPDPDSADMIPEEFIGPELSENPTQLEIGEYLYFYHCMPCHGDHGQGLTDEFRELWIPDHRNCWAAGCHTGRPEDEGFPIPRQVPGLIELQRFPNAQSLFLYLQATHPPQYPGGLTEEEYWAISAHTLYQAGRLDESQQIGPESEQGEQEATQVVKTPVSTETPQKVAKTPSEGLAALGIVLAAIILAALALIWQARLPIDM